MATGVERVVAVVADQPVTGGTGDIKHDERKWVCTHVIPIVNECSKWAWRTTSTLTVKRGQYGLFTNAGRRTRYQASCPDSASLHFMVAWDLIAQ